MPTVKPETDRVGVVAWDWFQVGRKLDHWIEDHGGSYGRVLDWGYRQDGFPFAVVEWTA